MEREMLFSKFQRKGGKQMAKRFKVDLELPDELFAELREDEIAAKAREALVMELLREHRFSQGKAADLLGVDRHQLFDLMSRYHVPVIDLSTEELKRELEKPLPHS
jgi:predicted HTH domain antitoxin